MFALLPQHEGYLPYYLLIPVLIGPLHTLTCFIGSPKVALTQFSGPAAPPPTGLLARVYGVKNIYTFLIRLYAAYNISNPQVYDLAIWTFVGVLFLYAGEVFVYKTSRIRETWSPFVMSTAAIVWMLRQREWYIS